ncbi:response regulator [Paenibacillus thermoaerophilus]|uniref:Response regulator n=1 Tax=Paenibacillus thermoaerophilus TaxID=1215385 RepID=A0ABW2V7T8_9BACL|nr:response regulator transcription factor [Paenibacillus thermoaerophilus]TMV12004.1 response regulator transcription factor [Paenibacillus thermoaerophilus]
MQPYRVLIADDHAHARRGIREIIEEDPLFEVVGEAKNGLEAYELTGEVMPDLILMDIRMPEADGLEATRRIKSKYPYVKIVMVTVSDDVADLFEAIKRGAQGYLLKNLSPSSWLDYLKAVAMDEAPMSREFASRLLDEFAAKRRAESKADDPLTAREREILEWVARGKSNREIGDELHISEHTVKNHLKNILQKLHLQNRVQLTRYAYEQGWV